MRGFIKLDRDAVDHAASLGDEYLGLYCRIANLVTYKGTMFKGVKLGPGELGFSYRKAADKFYSDAESAPSHNTVQARIKRLADVGLIELGEIRFPGTNKVCGTLLSVPNFGTESGTHPGTHPGTTQRRKKEKEGESARPTFEELKAYWSSSGLKGDPEAFFDHFESNGWRVSGRTPMKDWRAAARNWSRRQSEFSGGGNGRHEPPTEEIPVYRRAAR